jgi:hypothetical protein
MDRLDEYTVTKTMLDGMRNWKTLLKEAYEGDYSKIGENEDVVTDEDFPGVQDEIKQSLLQKIPSVKFDDDSITVNKEKSTITIRGSLPHLSDLTFIITTDISSSEGLYFSVEGLNLTGDSIKILQVLHGYAKTVVDEWTVNKVQDTFK